MKQRHSQRHNRLRAILKGARIRAGLTQRELCDLIKRGPNYVSTVELGTRMLDVLEFIEYAEAVGVDPRRVIGKLI